MKRGVALCGVTCILCSMVIGCNATGKYQFKSGTPLERVGDEIMVCGQLFHTGAPVVLWTDRGGYDAYRVECKFDPEHKLPTGAKNPVPNRYGTMRRHLPDDVKDDVYANGWSLEMLQEYVDQFVIHYDVCGTSQVCFRVLQDRRGLSVHFMLDLDGTIYQTLDLKERAWQAGTANDRSVGIEIANMGAYSDMKVLDKWYGKDDDGRTRVFIPERLGDGGIRTKDFIAYPSRDEVVVGPVQGKELMQYDLTDEQYDSLIKLTATLTQVLPLIKADYPRDENGELITKVLSDEEFDNYQGCLGHYHITARKVDPGPAFDWDRLMDGVQAELDR